MSAESHSQVLASEQMYYRDMPGSTETRLEKNFEYEIPTDNPLQAGSDYSIVAVLDTKPHNQFYDEDSAPGEQLFLVELHDTTDQNMGLNRYRNLGLTPDIKYLLVGPEFNVDKGRGFKGLRAGENFVFGRKSHTTTSATGTTRDLWDRFDASPETSRSHFSLRVDEAGKVYVTDQSRNGTSVYGRETVSMTEASQRNYNAAKNNKRDNNEEAADAAARERADRFRKAQEAAHERKRQAEANKPPVDPEEEARKKERMEFEARNKADWARHGDALYGETPQNFKSLVLGIEKNFAADLNTEDARLFTNLVKGFNNGGLYDRKAYIAMVRYCTSDELKAVVGTVKADMFLRVANVLLKENNGPQEHIKNPWER